MPDPFNNSPYSSGFLEALRGISARPAINVGPAQAPVVGGTNMLSGLSGRPGGTYMGAGTFPGGPAAAIPAAPIPTAPPIDNGSFLASLPYLMGSVNEVVGGGLADAGGWLGRAALDQLGMSRPAQAPAPAAPAQAPAVAPPPAGLAGSHAEFMASMRPLGDGSAPTGAGLLPDTLGLETPAGAVAASTSSPMRAIRMPDGRLLFTNREGYGGSEISTADAGREIRAADSTPAGRGPLNDVRPGGAFAGKSYEWPGMQEQTMAGLVAASQRAAAGEPPPSKTTGRQLEGHILGKGGSGGFLPSPDNLTGAGISRIQGSPEQQVQIALEQAMGATALAQLGQQQRQASLSPMEAATLGSPQAVAMMVGMQMVGPKIQQKQAELQAKIQLMGQPGTSSFIADEKLRAAEAERLTESVRQETNYMLSLAGLRPPTY
jgi:hypothetical protein